MGKELQIFTDARSPLCTWLGHFNLPFFLRNNKAIFSHDDKAFSEMGQAYWQLDHKLRLSYTRNWTLEKHVSKLVSVSV